MPIAAVPDYLGRDYAQASPGLRFGMYLPLWGVDQRSHEVLWATSDMVYEVRGVQREERRLPRENKSASLRQAAKLTQHDLVLMRALGERTAALAKSGLAAGHVVALEALAVAPFTTGLGNAHPLENGFAFLNPYGLPYLPGSGVKGVLRKAAHELALGDWGDTLGWTPEAIGALFGRGSASGDDEVFQRGALEFWDVIPQIAGDDLQLEIMTPHMTHYLQGNEAPHESGQPNPIHFLTVPPGSRFVFHVRCDLPFLERLAPELARDGCWQRLLNVAMVHAFQWLGFGAKTAVGYGAMRIDPEVAARREREAKAAREAREKAEADARRQQALAAMSPVERTIREYLDARADRNQSETAALFAALKRGEWSGETRLVAAGQVKAAMQAARKWKEKSEKKNPQKDHDHQDTLLVMKWLARD